MGSSWYGEPNLGNEHQRSARKGKKGSSENKPKQPQRGLGVAQLEKIRIHSQLGCTYLPPPSSFHPHHHHPYPTTFDPQQVGMGELERSNFMYAADSQASPTDRWNPCNGILESQHFAQPSDMTRRFFAQQEEDSLQKKRKKDRSRSMGSSSHNYEPCDAQEPDLELRLSL